MILVYTITGSPAPSGRTQVWLRTMGSFPGPRTKSEVVFLTKRPVSLAFLPVNSGCLFYPLRALDQTPLVTSAAKQPRDKT